jgi:hypothetical protein
MNKQQEEKKVSWFLILLLIGIAICIPKLFRPVRIEKQGYREAAEWLRENITPKDIIAVPDKRISFYAERKGLIYDKRVPKQAKYVVRIEEDKDEEPKFDRAVQEEYSVWVDKRKEKGKRLVIYKVM